MSIEAEDIIYHISLEQARITFDEMFNKMIKRGFNGSADDVTAVVPAILRELDSPYSSNPFYLQIVDDMARVQIIPVAFGKKP